MKVETSAAGPKAYSPITVTITFETLAEAKAFRAVVGHPYAVAELVSKETVPRNAGVSHSSVYRLLQDIASGGGVDFSIYSQKE